MLARLVAVQALLVAVLRVGAIDWQFGQNTNVTNSWQTVFFDSTIATPVVFATPSTNLDTPDPVVVQVRSVGANSFQMRVKEPINCDGVHQAETVSWLVVKSGTTTLPDGRRIVAGRQTNQDTRAVKNEWFTVSFTAFSSTPVIYSQLNTLLGTDRFIGTRNSNPATSSFRFAMEREELYNDVLHGTGETVGWMAVQSGASTMYFDNIRFDLQTFSQNSIGDAPTLITFSSIPTVPNLSGVITNIATFNGNNPAWTRRTVSSGNTVRVWCEEDQTKDAEQSHTGETISLMAASCSVNTLTIGSSNGPYAHSQLLTLCPWIYFVAAPGEVPFVSYQVTVHSTGIPAVYVGNSTAPNATSFVTRDITNSSSAMSFVLVNPHETLTYLGITRDDQPWNASISVTTPSSAAFGIGINTTLSCVNNWIIRHFTLNSTYDNVQIIAQPLEGSTIQLFYRVGAMATIARFTARQLTPNVGGQYVITIVSPAVSTDFYVGVYSPVISTQSVSLMVRPAAPIITVMDPAYGTTQGGFTLTISGSNFGNGYSFSIAFGSGSCGEPFVFGAGTVRCTVPAGEGRSIIVSVTHIGQTSNSAVFNYDAPVLSSLAVVGEADGRIPTVGGAELVLTGSNFGLSGAVTINGIAATIKPGTYSHTSVTVFTAPGQGVGQGVEITVAGQGSNVRLIDYKRPSLSAVAPASGPTAGGTNITLTGTNFGVGGSSSASINNQNCAIVFHNHTQVVCTLPVGQGRNLPINLIVASQTLQNPFNLDFSYQAPNISSISPTVATSVGTVLTVVGSSFGTSGSVSIGDSGVVCSPVTSWNHTHVVCQVPEGQGTGLAVRVTTSSQTSNAVSFSYAPPNITSISPSLSPTLGGVNVTVTGTSLGTSGIATANGLSCPIVFHNHTTIVCTLPAGQGTLRPLFVTVGGQTSNSVTFNYMAPQLNTVGPDVVRTDGSQVITLQGSNFGTSGSVLVANNLCSITGAGWSDSYIECLSPAGQGTGLQVVVTVSGQNSSGLAFAYLPPAIVTIAPQEGPTQGGTTLTLRGSDFGLSGAVTVNGVACTPQALYTHTQVECAIPAGRGSALAVQISVAAQVAINSTFSYAAPSISGGITPTSASTAGGVLITLSGSSFDTDGTVTVGGAACNVSGVAGANYSHTSIVCRLPPGQGVAQPVVVTTVDNKVSAAGSFSYSAPSIGSVSAPAGAPTAGNVPLVVSGSSFGLSGAVSVGGRNCTPIASWSHTAINCSLPAGSGTGQSVVVTVASQSSNAMAFAYTAPSLNGSFVPSEGSTAGGFNLTIFGANFGADGTVSATVGGASCTVVSRTQTAVVCTTPAGAGNAAVVVTVAGQTSNVATFPFAAPNITSVSPSAGPTQGGINVTLAGSSFGTSGVVLVGGNGCPIVLHNHTTVVCTLPAGSGAARSVTLSVGGKLSNTASFSYNAPSISSVTPVLGPTAGGTALTLNGSDFGAAGFVLVGGRSCTPTTGGHSHTSVVCTLPTGQGANQSVQITVDGQASNTVNFSYNAPVVSSVTPQGLDTAGGSTLTLSGSDFGTSGTILVGSSTCSVQSGAFHTHTQIQCQLPEGQGTQQVSVTVSGQTSNSLSFTYAAPSITVRSPTNGPTPGGTMLTLFGSNFGTSGEVRVDGRTCNASAVNAVYTHTRIECGTPHGVGSGREINMTVGGQNAVSPATFRYDAPVLVAVAPSVGPTNGSATLTLTGSNFGIIGTASVSVGGRDCPIATRNHSTITCALPVGAGANQLVTVVVESQSSSSLPLFSYSAPAVSRVSSSDCVDTGNTTKECPTSGASLTIYGSNFGLTGASVSINNVTCGSVLHDGTSPHSMLTCSMPAGLGFDLALRVTVAAQTSNALLLSYAGPLLYANTLRLAGAGSSAGHVNASSVAGGEDVEMEGKYLQRFSNTTTVRYGAPGTAFASMPFTCTMVFANSTYIRCTLGAGVGTNLRFVVDDGEQVSPESEDFVRYPQPVVLASTIRETLGGAGLTALTGSRSEGETVFFDVQHVGSVASLVSVRYGQPGGPYSLACTQVTLMPQSAPNVSVSCRTSPGEGTGFVFQVTALNYASSEGTDTYSYPQSPVVYRVTGCPTNNASSNATSECPTIGGDLLSIVGDHFSAQVTVKIGVADCIDVEKVNSSFIRCVNPPGAGADTQVVVVSGELFSRARALLSYASATITSVSGCAVTDGANTADCARAGGTTVTVSGSNFGASSALVLVGGSFCSSVAHDGTTPHSRLTCQLPAGTQLLRPLMLIQDRGEVSLNSRFVSYVQCPAGTFDATNSSTLDVACTNCSAGSFSNTAGQFACTSCENGFFAASSGMTTCVRCSKGFYSQRVNGAGATECTPCPAGKYASSDGQEACLDCPAGTFSSMNESTWCQSCAVGRFASGAASTVCSNCTAGRYAGVVGTVTCDLCSIGRAAGSAGASSCALCERGTFASSEGLTACLNCAVGTAIDSEGQGVCNHCDSGFFSNDTGLTSCLYCPAGRFSVKVGGQGATTCSVCPVGEYIGSTGQGVCLRCPQGTFANSTGSTACARCARGTFSDDVGFTACQPCSAGSFAAEEGAVTCASCQAGSYSAAASATVCVACEAGRFQAQSGRTTCTNCSAGEAVATIGQPACVPCDVGTFAATSGSVECSRCPAGFVAASTGRTGCTGCDAGYFSESEAQGFCKPCAVGTFNNATNRTACEVCGAGEVASAAAATTCVACGAGFFSPAAGGQTCERCPAGRFSNATRASACSVCEVGRAQSATNQDACTPCSTGFYSASTGQAVCLACPSGTFANVSGASACGECPPGMFQDQQGQSACVPCAEGWFSSASRQPTCIRCPVGRFGNVTGASDCSSCAAGRFSDAAGSTVCTACAAGRFADEVDSLTCKECNVGFFSNTTGQTGCVACAAGRYQAATGRTVCTACEAGKAQPSSSQATCNDCPVGSFNPSTAQLVCQSCAAGSFSSSAAALGCQPCGTGTFASGSGSVTCAPCPVGRFANVTGLSTCAPCPAGTFQDVGGQSSCKPCEAGTANGLEGQRTCGVCLGGTFANATALTVCDFCPAGTFSGFQASTCTACESGRFGSVKGLDACVDCPVGFFSNETARTVCTACVAGRYASAARSTECLPCTVGYAAVGFASQLCEICGVGSFSAAQGSASCSPCPVGHYQDREGESACARCPPGQYASATGQAVCVQCPVGFFSSGNGSTACVACDAGRYQSATGRSACVDCALGSAVNARGQALCVQCDAGLFGNATSLDVCFACPVGMYSVKDASGNGATTCTPCDVGRYSSALGQPLCLPCPAGMYANETGQAQCTNCPAGTYTNSPGTVRCVDCDPGRFSVNGDVLCEACPTGTYMPFGAATSCIACPQGRYERNTGSTECSNCTAGTFMASTGALLCDLCPPGTYTNRSGVIECDECGPGRFQDEYGQVVCKPCGPGSFTTALRQRLCSPCAPGTATNASAATKCSECQPGSFQEAFGSTSCRSCPLGRFNPATSQTECLLCDAGRFSNITAQTACLLCGNGTFQAVAGSSQCDQCPMGQFQIALGAASCIPCEEGKYGNRTAAVSCVSCPSGSANEITGRTRCDACRAGFYSQEGQVTCQACQPGLVQPNNGSSGCIPCGANAQPNFFKTECECSRGFFLPDNAGIVTECRSCPFGADCTEAGVRFTTMEARPGYWRASLTDEYFMRCTVRRHCVGGFGEFDSEGNYLGSRCQDNRFGPLCSLCKVGFYASPSGDCTACPTEGRSWVFFVFVALVIAFVVWLQLFLILRAGNHLMVEAQKELEEELEQARENIDGVEVMPDGTQMPVGHFEQGKAGGAEVGDAEADFSEEEDEDEGDEDGDDAESGDAEEEASSGSQSGSDSASHTATESGTGTGTQRSLAGAQQSMSKKGVADETAAGSKSNPLAAGPAAEVANDDEQLTVHGPPPQRPNFTYTLKIALSFMQIVTNLGSGLEMQWPERFKTFISYFDVTNFNYIMASGVDCVSSLGYYRRFLIIATVPVIFMILIFVVYLLPKRLGHPTPRDALRFETNYWRMFLYVLFLVYPGVSSTVLRHYVCKNVYGTDYLLTDMHVKCFTDQWNMYALGSISLVILYPIGIPLFFFVLLRVNKDNLAKKRVQAALGFLYAGYRDEVWWFEVADCFHKLTLTSVLAFFPAGSQLPIGMVVCVAYLMVILHLNPYLRPEDDRLHQLAQVEIFLIITAGNVFYNLDVPVLSDKDDLVMTVCLIAITLVFLVTFFWQAISFVRRVLRRKYRELVRFVRRGREPEKKAARDVPAADADGNADAPGRRTTAAAGASVELAAMPPTGAPTVMVLPGAPGALSEGGDEDEDEDNEANEEEESGASGDESASDESSGSGSDEGGSAGGGARGAMLDQPALPGSVPSGDASSPRAGAEVSAAAAAAGAGAAAAVGAQVAPLFVSAGRAEEAVDAYGNPESPSGLTVGGAFGRAGAAPRLAPLLVSGGQGSSSNPSSPLPGSPQPSTPRRQLPPLQARREQPG